MTDPRIELRNPILAAVLAFLFPGAGHVYQRRYFKAAIYSICVLGIYFWGCSLGEAKAVHFRWDDKAEDGQTRQRTIGYLAQVGVGLPALPAIIQQWRHVSQHETSKLDLPPGEVIEEIDAEFTGNMEHTTLGHGTITGQLSGIVLVGEYGHTTGFEGRFTGQTSDGVPVNFDVRGSNSSGAAKLGDRVTGLDNVTIVDTAPEPQRLVFSGDRRRFYARIVDKSADHGKIEGTIPRPLFNHLLAPLDDEALQYLNGKLGKQYELALVYTWIAGLLNILAVWDALQGPAYGYGDEEPETETDEESSDKSPGKSKAVEASVPQPETTSADLSS